MWLSLETASMVADIAGVLAIISAATAFVMTNLKEAHWDEQKRQSAERVSLNEKETQVAKEGAALAEQRAAEANARAAEAQLQLARLRAPRVLTAEQRLDIAAKMAAWKTLKGGETQRVAVFALNNDLEAVSLANQIADALGQSGAGWAINRYPVMYGESFAADGVGLLATTTPRGVEVASALLHALDANGIASSIVFRDHAGCSSPKKIEEDSGCSAISVMVGNKPR